MLRIVKVLLLIELLLIFSIGCSSDVTGGGTDTSNSIVMGTIIDTDSTLVEGAYVTLLPVNYNPVADSENLLSSDTTLSQGEYRVVVEDDGYYNLYVVNPRNNRNFLIKSLYLNKDTLDTIEIMISDPSTIKVSVSDFSDYTPQYLYIPGTPIFVNVDTVERTFIPNVPAVESLSVNMVTDENENITIVSDIEGISNDTVQTPFNVIMLVGGDTTTYLTDRIKEQRQLLLDSGAIVTMGNFNTFDVNDYNTSKIDLIYCSYNVDWSSVKADEFVNLPLNIALCSGEGYAKLGMIHDSAGITYGASSEYNIMTGVNGNHPVLDGTGTSSSATMNAYNGGDAPWGKVENVNTTGILIGVADQKRKYVFVYQKGAAMVEGIAPASRIALFSGDVDLGDSRGRMILWRTMLWGSGKL